jgi:hypothetical protein
MTKIGNGSIPLRLGNLINTTVYGGPYRNCPASMFGVKMAEEIDIPHDVSVPTRDFCVPEMGDMRRGVMLALMAMVQGEDVYAGCMGGIGRTGLFLGVLAKVQIDYRKYKHRPGRGVDPVDYVRENFIPHAIETDEQQKFVREFDTDDIVRWIDVTQTAMGLGGMTPPKEEEPVDFSWLQDNKPLVDMAELVERDLDWIDAIEADSADEHPEVSVTDQINDVWQYLDESDDQLEKHHQRLDKLEAQVRVLQVTLGETRQEVSGLDNFVKTMFEKVLTKAPIFDRLRSLFR